MYICASFLTMRRGFSPFFISMELKDKILDFVSSHLEKPEHFVVSVSIQKSARPKIEIILDGDKGVDIDTCSKINRLVGLWIEEQGLMESSYVLEVSSPGVGEPLLLPRQYAANLGRTLQVTRTDGSILVGKLLEFKPDVLILETNQPKKTKSSKNQNTTAPLIEIPFSDIKKAIVVIEF